MRTLLARPLLTMRHENFAVVRKHAEWLREWLHRNTGWRLHLAPAFARLWKAPGDLDDATRPSLGAQGRPFTRRTYAWFCLALAFLESCNRQTTLGKLADGLAGETQIDPRFSAIRLDLEKRDHRQDLVQVVRLLISLGLVEKVDGSEEEFLSGRGDALYRIEHACLSTLLQVRRAPSSIQAGELEERLRLVMDEAYEATNEGENRRIRHGLTRRLLEDPIVYWEDLSPQEREYLTGQWPHVTRQIAEATGLIAEVRAEGVAMVDESGELTDLSLPEEGTEGHITLLLAEHLAACHRQAPGASIPLDELEVSIRAWTGQYGRYWRKDAREPGAESYLLRNAVDRLTGLRLVKLTGGALVPRAAIGRYALGRITTGGAEADLPAQRNLSL